MNRLDKVDAYLRDNKSRFVEELTEYLRFPSVSAQPQRHPDLLKCVEWLANHFRSIGLDATVAATKGNPVVIASARRQSPERRPHFLIYGHYDVQPADPFELWHSPPFEPEIRNGSLFARGASDNKGQHFAHLKAVEAYLRTGTELPCDLTFVIEGEEEVGSQNLNTFIEQHRDSLDCDGVVISDTTMPSLNLPAITSSLRGIVSVEIKLSGPSQDLHSGVHGGAVENPATVLCMMLAQCRDAERRVSVPGFYDDVCPLTDTERTDLRRVPLDPEDYRSVVGVPQLAGETGYTVLEQRTSRPTFEINGISGGYQGEGMKTIIPATASAKLSFRLVAEQKPEIILRAVRDFLTNICPATVGIEITPGFRASPFSVKPDSALVDAGRTALRQAFGHEPVLMREGVSIPVVAVFKELLGADSLLLGLALPDDNMHAPNEKFSLEAFQNGMRMSAFLWPELAARTRV